MESESGFLIPRLQHVTARQADFPDASLNEDQDAAIVYDAIARWASTRRR